MAKIPFYLLGILSISFLNADEGSGCHHCDEIRLYNAKHHHNYEYYEDYLKSEGAENKSADAQPAKTPSLSPTENTALREKLPPQ